MGNQQVWSKEAEDHCQWLMKEEDTVQQLELMLQWSPIETSTLDKEQMKEEEELCQCLKKEEDKVHQLELDLQRAYIEMPNIDKQKARRKGKLSQCTKKKKILQQLELELQTAREFFIAVFRQSILRRPEGR